MSRALTGDEPLRDLGGLDLTEALLEFVQVYGRLQFTPRSVVAALHDALGDVLAQGLHAD